MKKIIKFVKKFFSSYIALLVFAFITSIVALVYAGLIKSSYKSYSFHGYNEFISVSSGVITLTSKTNLFEGNNINYIADEEINVTEYQIGYFLMNGDTYEPIIETTGKLKEKTSLKTILNSIIGFDFEEPARMEENKISTANRKLIKDNLYFRISFKTSEDSEVSLISVKMYASEIN